LRPSTAHASSKDYCGASRSRPTPFVRIVKEHKLLKPDSDDKHKRRLAFAKAHANEL